MMTRDGALEPGTREAHGGARVQAPLWFVDAEGKKRDERTQRWRLHAMDDRLGICAGREDNEEEDNGR